MRWPQLNMAAGPVEVSPRTLRDMARPVMYHYDPAFIELFAHTSRSAQAGLPHAVRRRDHAGRGDARAGSGRGQPDPAGRQGAQPRLRRLRQVVRGLHRAASAARRSRSRVPYNEAIDPEDVRKALNANPGIKYLSVVHSETPSGTHNPVQEIGKIAHEFGVLTMVDTVSGLGGEMLSPEDWGMDIAIAGPQKCLSGTPGLALMSIIAGRLGGDGDDRRSRLRGSYLSILDWKTTWLEKRNVPLHAARLRDVRAGVGPDPDPRGGDRAAGRAAPADRRRLPDRGQGARSRALAGARGDRRALRDRDQDARRSDRRGHPRRPCASATA